VALILLLILTFWIHGLVVIVLTQMLSVHCTVAVSIGMCSWRRCKPHALRILRHTRQMYSTVCTVLCVLYICVKGCVCVPFVTHLPVRFDTPCTLCALQVAYREGRVSISIDTCEKSERRYTSPMSPCCSAVEVALPVEERLESV
jgi:hypothetical protein